MFVVYRNTYDRDGVINKSIECTFETEFETDFDPAWAEIRAQQYADACNHQFRNNWFTVEEEEE
jgi:hypothetical protein